MQIPIIFIHFSNSSYLKYSLASAQLFNPNKRIILLGDHTNAHFKKKGIEHHYFDNYAEGEEIELFDRVYQFITGGIYLNEVKTNFFFRRWFHIYNFLCAHDIERFWTFDSDNLILSNLTEQEDKFKDYDCTEQCSGACMNGLINSRLLVKGYVDKINELFQRKDYLEERRRVVKATPRFIFNEMDAYETYKKEKNFKSIRLNSIINGESFDDCLSADQGMAMRPGRLRGKKRMKQLYVSNDHFIFCYHLASKEFVKLNVINMSWRLPDFLFRLILHQAKKGLKCSKPYCHDNPNRSIEPLDMSESWLMGKIRKTYAKLRKHTLIFKEKWLN